MENGLVSIVMPCYNAENFIKESINSVINQTYKNWELIIVDDCSIDNSSAIIKKFIKKDSRIKTIQLEKNSGAAISRNRGIEIANGKYIAFLDSDDIWFDIKLEKQISHMKKNNSLFSYTSYCLINDSSRVIGNFITKKKLNYKELLKTCPIGCSTVVYDCEKLGKIYMPIDAYKREDYAMWLNVFKKINYSEGIIEPLSYYRIYSNSVSSNKLKMAYYQWKVYRNYENFNIFKSIYYFTFYSINGVLKYK